MKKKNDTLIGVVILLAIFSLLLLSGLLLFGYIYVILTYLSATIKKDSSKKFTNKLSDYIPSDAEISELQSLNKKIGRLNVTYRHKIDQAARNKDGSISRRSNVGKEAYQANIEISNLYKDYDALYNSKFDKINRVERLFYLTLASFFGLLWLLFAWDSSIVFNSNDKFQSIIGLAMLSATSLIVSVPVGLIAKIYSAIKTKHVKCAILDLINGKSLNYRDKSNKGNLIVWLASAVVFYFITVNTNEFLFGKPFAYNINYLVGDELASDCEMYYVLPSKLNVRGKSNSKSNVVGKLTKGEGVCISRVENNWGLIVHSKNDEPYGWASMKYLVENSQKL